MADSRENGEGTIYEDKKRNRWRAQYYDGVNSNGKLLRKSIYGKTRKEVVDKLTDIMYKKNNNLYLKKNNITLIEIIEGIKNDKFNSNIISEGQYARIESTAKKIKDHRIGSTNIQDLTSDDIQSFLNQNKYLSNSCIRKLYELINGACKSAVKKKIIYSNPIEDVMKPKSTKPDKEIRALTLEEQTKFANYLNSVNISEESYKVCFMLEMYMGLRIGEALALRSDDINLKKNIITITRTLTRDKNFNVIMNNRAKTIAGRRTLPIPNILRKDLKEQLEISKKNKDNQLFMCGKEYVRPTAVNTVLKRILKTQLGIENKGINTHSLRHTYATRSIEAGMTPVVLQKLMGHTDVKITLNTYTSVFNEFKQDELDKVAKYLNKSIFNRNKNLDLEQ